MGGGDHWHQGVPTNELRLNVHAKQREATGSIGKQREATGSAGKRRAATVRHDTPTKGKGTRAGGPMEH